MSSPEELQSRVRLLEDQLQREQQALDAINDWEGQNAYAGDAGSPRVHEACYEKGRSNRWVWRDHVESMLTSVAEGRKRFEE